MFLAVLGVVLAVAEIRTLVPRVRLREALILFATAFGAGAALTKAVEAWRRDPNKRAA